MVSETTNILLGGIIAGWLVAVSQPVYEWLSARLTKWGMPKLAAKILLAVIWLIALMVLVVKIYG